MVTIAGDSLDKIIADTIQSATPNERIALIEAFSLLNPLAPNVEAMALSFMEALPEASPAMFTNTGWAISQDLLDSIEEGLTTKNGVIPDKAVVAQRAAYDALVIVRCHRRQLIHPNLGEWLNEQNIDLDQTEWFAIRHEYGCFVTIDIQGCRGNRYKVVGMRNNLPSLKSDVAVVAYQIDRDHSFIAGISK